MEKPKDSLTTTTVVPETLNAKASNPLTENKKKLIRNLLESKILLRIENTR
jgi:hypothetical protein